MYGLAGTMLADKQLLGGKYKSTDNLTSSPPPPPPPPQ